MGSVRRFLFVCICICVAGRTNAEEAFAGCNVTAANHEGWKAVCAQGWLLTIADGPQGTRTEDYADGLVTGLRAATGGQVQRETSALVLPGGSWRITKFHVNQARERGPSVALLAVAERREGRRFLSCIGTADTQSRCTRAMEIVAATAWRSGPPVSIPRDAKPPTIAGREYAIPDGCEVTSQPNATYVVCGGDPVLLWAQPPNDLDAIDRLMEAKMRERGLKESRVVSCSVEGATAKCRVFKPTGGGPAAYFARANVRGQPLSIVCLTNDSSRALPAACASVLSLGVASKAAPGPASADTQALQGTWEVVSAESNGEPPPPEMRIIGAKFVFAGDVLQFLGGQVSFTLDDTDNPRQIDLGHNKQQLGIYELHGDTLKLCIGPSDDRPKQFGTKPRTNHSLFLLKRRR